MIIKTSDVKAVQSFFKRFNLPKKNSHKGQNGRVLIIGGSSLFHAASIWAAETASYFVDIVHYSSTKENNEIFLSLKKKFQNGIIIRQNDLPSYVEEDDAILVGPGMLRGKIINNKLQITNYKDILNIKDEVSYTYYLTKYLMKKFPDKKFVFDAGALQMMDKNWLLKLQSTPILTPHQGEFERLFGIPIKNKSPNEKLTIVQDVAKTYHSIILLKSINDIISDGQTNYVIQGGNPGLTKGGTGDVLAGLCLAFLSKNSPLDSAVLASLLLKSSADRLFNNSGYWYNIPRLIEKFPEVLQTIVF